MGKFDGMLLVSDYDNTLCYTESALRNNGVIPPVHPRNLEAIRRWMAGGGRFAVATGRALAAFRRQAEEIPMNAPSIVDNGGAIYDLAAERYVLKRFLPDSSLERVAAAMEAFPGVSLELYHEGPSVQVVHPSDWNVRHAKLTGLAFQAVDRLERESVELPVAKALFVAERSELERLLSFLEERGWSGDYELIFSNDHLLEMTAKGANKGGMALHLKELCGCGALYCVGDHANDLPMLRAARRAFAPANAIEEVRDEPGVETVGHCLDGALADVIERLEEEIDGRAR